jgi:hypothetical protein
LFYCTWSAWRSKLQEWPVDQSTFIAAQSTFTSASLSSLFLSQVRYDVLLLHTKYADLIHFLFSVSRGWCVQEHFQFFLDETSVIVRSKRVYQAIVGINKHFWSGSIGRQNW